MCFLGVWANTMLSDQQMTCYLWMPLRNFSVLLLKIERIREIVQVFACKASDSGFNATLRVRYVKKRVPLTFYLRRPKLLEYKTFVHQLLL